MSGWTPISPWKLGAVQKLTTGAASAKTTAFGSETRALLVSCTADCHIVVAALSANPAAVAGSTLLKANWPPVILGCDPADALAAIQDVGAGSVYVTELSH